MNNLRNEALLLKVGARLRELREGKTMSMDDVAAECGINKKQIYLIEKGKNNITISTLEVLANTFGITLAELFKEV
jgi:transcriptional regulator with XRE-family HTH domain